MTNAQEVSKFLSQALATGRTALSEHESRILLRAYGIPTVEERLVKSAAEAQAGAQEIGYPVAVKACGAELLHKTERGLVRLNLRDAEELGTACAELDEHLGDTPFDGFLVQRMARGTRELVVGGVRDALFGPAVMFGLGGIAVEAIRDVSFRLAPLDLRDARELIAETIAGRLLGPFRGEPAADIDALAHTLVAVGELLVSHPEIAQLDINPILIEHGKPIAVDALATLSPAPPIAAPVTDPPIEAMRALFEPASLAIIGVSDTPTKWGFRILYNTLEGGYDGALYGVNPKYQELLGVPCFPSLEAIPGPVDLAFVVVPPAGVLPSLRACAAKGVKAAVVITAGYGEVGGAEARAAEQALADFSAETGMLVVGPNCAGIVSPAPHRLYCGMIARFPEAGGLAVVSQSGNVGSTSLTWAGLHQVGVSRFVSTGNEAATRCEDYLDFLAADEKTRSVLAYVEGTRDGRRLFEVLRRISAHKPVVVVKGGRTGAGMRAAQSHTGSLASEVRLFRAACRQAGAAFAEDIYEAMETAGVLMTRPLPKGRRVVIVSQGGGWGVIAADFCAEAGLEVIALPKSILEELDTFLPSWWSRNNPIDLVANTDIRALSRTVETVVAHEEVDAVLLLGVGYIASAHARYAESARAIEHGLDRLTELGTAVELEDARHIASLSGKYGKPIVCASDTSLLAYGARPNEVVRELEQQGLYIFSSLQHAARALAHLADRAEFLRGEPRVGRV